MTRAASAMAFRLLLAGTVGAVLLLDMTLAHARATRELPAKLATDCATVAPPPAPLPVRPAPAALPDTTSAAGPPPGFAAAFGSCGDTAANPGQR